MCKKPLIALGKKLGMLEKSICTAGRKGEREIDLLVVDACGEPSILATSRGRSQKR